MKQRIGFGITFLLFVMLVAVAPVSAKTYEENGFSYRVSNKQAVVTGVTGEGDLLVIPNTLGGFPVTKIGTRALAKRNMSKVIFPSALKQIDYAAFRNCRKLREVSFPVQLKKLDERAFSGCTALTAVHFNKGLEKVGEYAFSNCIALKKVVLPGKVKSIGQRSFEKCYKLSSVKLNKKLEKIGDGAFYKAYALKSAAIPSGVKDIGDKAFSNCDNLVRVTFASGTTRLGDGVFYGCESLKKAVLPKQIKSIPEATFSGCRSIKKVTIPKRVSLIKKRAFYGCRALKSVKLNKKVYALGDNAFACSGLKRLKLNARMQFIGNGAFRETKLQSLKLTSKVTFIGNRVFANCSKLKTIYIPASVKGVNPGAFQNCISLRAIHVAGGNKNYTSTEGVLYDKGRKKLIQYPLHKTNVSFRTPSGLQKIRNGAFAENPYLKHVTISAKQIGSRAFAEMSALQTVTIQNGAVSIDSGAFDGDDSLTKITLPDSVTKIGYAAFRQTAVGRIHIPSRLKKLDGSAFENCKKLVAFEGGRGSHYSVSDGVLYNGKKTTLIKYPARRRGTFFAVPNTVKVVRREAFDHVNNLTRIEFGTGLRELNGYAVYRAKNLKSVVFQSRSLYYGSSYAISDCDKLAVIVGPDTYTFRSIARNANATLISL